MPPPPNLPAPWALGAPSTPCPAPAGCPVNRVISHPHLDSCESGPPHPTLDGQPPRPPKALLSPTSLLGLPSWTNIRWLGSWSSQPPSGSVPTSGCPCPASVPPHSGQAPLLRSQGARALAFSSLLSWCRPSGLAHSSSVALPSGTSVHGGGAPRQPLPFLAPD